MSTSSMRLLWVSTLSFLCVAFAAPAHGQDRDPLREILPEGDDMDPLGVGTLGPALQDVPLRSRGETPPAIDQGATLAAIPGVREVDHDISVHLRDGLASVAVRQRFTSSTRALLQPELRYRIPLPEGATLRSLEACRGDVCTAAAVGESSSYESAFERDGDELSASVILRDGVAWLRIAPLTNRATVEARWSYVVPVQAHGGVMRLELPARDRDLRIAPATVTFLAEGYVGPQVQGANIGTRSLGVEPGQPIAFRAQLRPGTRRSRTFYACSSGRCVREYREVGVAAPRPVRHALLLDVSPSTFGPMQGRMTEIVAALVTAAPSGSTFRAAAFAGRAEPLLAEPTQAVEVPRDLTARALGHQLGPSTRVGTALEAFSPSRGEHVIIVGDGGLTSSRSLRVPRGVRVSYVLLGDALEDELQDLVEASGGSVVQTDARGEALVEHLAALSASRIAGLVAGTNLETRQPSRRRGRLASPDLAAALDGQKDLSVVGASGPSAGPRILSDGPPVVLRVAPPAASAPAVSGPNSNTPQASLSREPVLLMLRTRIVPAARACFRRDRRGREDYATRAVFELSFEHREIRSARVVGEIPSALRRCLESSVDTLEVPAFRGVINVRYPLYTVRVGPSMSIELVDEARDAVDRVAGDAPSDGRSLLAE